MTAIHYTGDALWNRIELAVEKVRDRLHRVTKALGDAGIPYAVVGGNAVQLWVAQVDDQGHQHHRTGCLDANEADLFPRQGPRPSP